jgi:hypothetical protein
VRRTDACTRPKERGQWIVVDVGDESVAQSSRKVLGPFRASQPLYEVPPRRGGIRPFGATSERSERRPKDRRFKGQWVIEPRLLDLQGCVCLDPRRGGFDAWMLPECIL